MIGNGVQLKWPNDVYLNDKKCAGILTEIVGDRVMIGIGVNVSVNAFPDEIAMKATSLLREGISVEREKFLAAIVSQIFQLGSLAGDGGFGFILKEYRQFCMLTGKKISFVSEDRKGEGTVKGISDEGALLVEDDGVETAVMEARDIILA